ncbi:MAG: PaaI family thioesterase [Deltaproteobacteria bacterium]|nr:PaaI family thioesterase [Deltaproteobacteria bacterium]
MTQRTHLGIDAELVGTVTSLGSGTATVSLVATPSMTADDRGLVHGGFTFGLADYAAMCAVNDPNVVLGGADTRFLAPVIAGQEMVATATVTGQKGRKRTVTVAVTVEDREVMTGTFTTFVLDQHVLDG